MGKAEYVFFITMLAAIFAALLASHTAGPPDNILYHYQTFIIGLLTLASALLAAFLLHRQTTQASEVARDLKASQRQAARSWLSLHLLSILNYAEENGKGVWRLINACDGNGQLRDNAAIPDFPALPMDAAAALKEFAAFARADEARFIAVMLSTMQVLHSRLGDFRSSRRPRSNILNLEAYLKDAAELYAQAEALLQFARHKTEEFPEAVTRGRYRAAFFVFTRTHEPTERIAEHLKQSIGTNPDGFLPNRFERD